MWYVPLNSFHYGTKVRRRLILSLEENVQERLSLSAVQGYQCLYVHLRLQYHAEVLIHPHFFIFCSQNEKISASIY